MFKMTLFVRLKISFDNDMKANYKNKLKNNYMPKKCKPTKEAVDMRIKAYYRQLRRLEAQNNIVPLDIFGIKHRIKKEGIFTIDDIIKELKK